MHSALAAHSIGLITLFQLLDCWPLEGRPEKVGRKPIWSNYMPQARAVLQAVREADTSMAKAGEKILDYPMGSRTASAMANQVWEAMADTAIKESVEA